VFLDVRDALYEQAAFRGTKVGPFVRSICKGHLGPRGEAD